MRRSIRMTTRIVREETRASIVGFAGIACAASVFVNHAFSERCVRDVVARRRDR
jgi:hypothetical protein